MPSNRSLLKNKFHSSFSDKIMKNNYQVIICNYITDAFIGVYKNENGRKQKIRISLNLKVKNIIGPTRDRLEEVVCYDYIVRIINNILSMGHINLVETLAEKIAFKVFEDNRIINLRIRIEKLQAVKKAESVGVEIEWNRKE